MSDANNKKSNDEVSNQFDRDFWEQLWTKMLSTHGDKLAHKKANDFLIEQVRTNTSLPSGRALDAGCGHGAETLWLAAHGWNVTAVDFSVAALEKGKLLAAAAGVDERIDWVEGDLGTCAPTEGRYNLVLCLYVHVAGSVKDMILRLASGVAPGGTLLMTGNRPIDPKSVLVSGQVQVSIKDATEALGKEEWEMIVAEDRTLHTGVHSMICARRRR